MLCVSGFVNIAQLNSGDLRQFCTSLQAYTPPTSRKSPKWPNPHDVISTKMSRVSFSVVLIFDPFQSSVLWVGLLLAFSFLLILDLYRVLGKVTPWSLCSKIIIFKGNEIKLREHDSGLFPNFTNQFICLQILTITVHAFEVTLCRLFYSLICGYPSNTTTVKCITTFTKYTDRTCFNTDPQKPKASGKKKLANV